MPRDRADIVKSLSGKGFTIEQKGRDHDFLFFAHDGRLGPIFTKVSRGKAHKTIGDPLLARMRRQLHLVGKEFDQLIDCPLTREGYEAKLRERGKLAPANDQS
jgi:hypothetical protein